MNLKLFFDEKFFLGSGKRKIVFLAGLVLLAGLLVFAWDEWGAPILLGKTIGTGRSLRETLLGMLGALEFSGLIGGAEFGRAVFMRFFSVVVFGGLLVSTLCSMMQQREEKVRAGLVRYRGMRKHYIVIGWGPLAVTLIKKVLDGDMDAWHPGGAGRRSWAERNVPFWPQPRLLLFTSSDVATVRRELESRLPASLYRRIVFYHGSIDIAGDDDAKSIGGGKWWKTWMRFETRRNPFDTIFLDMGAAAARQIYLLADAADEQGRDAKLLAFAQGLCDRLQTRKTTSFRHFLRLPQVIPVLAELDARGSQDYAKRLDFVTVRTKVTSGKDENNNEAGATIPYFRPFSFHEMWARRLFAVDAPDEYRLDYRAMGKGDYVHLVIAGFNRMGSALALEAIRSCHYVNFNPDDRERRTRTTITVVDRNPQETAFRARYPHLNQVEDVEIKFIEADVASDDVRKLLRAEALNPHCLLTVAICPEDSDTALSIALGLPEEVYRRQEIGAKEKGRLLKHRRSWKAGGNHVLVRQNLITGAAGALSMATKGPYACVHAFGMIPDVITADSFEERTAMYHNAIYNQPDEIEKAGARENNDKVAWLDGVCRARKKLAKEIPVAFEKYVSLDREKVWSNVYMEDSYGAILRALGLDVSHRDGAAGIPLCDARLKERLDANLALFPFDSYALTSRLSSMGIAPNDLKSVEHRRWMAERTLMGYRAPTCCEERDDAYRIHPSIEPFARLDGAEIGKDDDNIRAIPVILALEGYQLELARHLQQPKEQMSCPRKGKRPPQKSESK